MPTTEQPVTSFYDAFARRDHATMASLYADDAVFSDPVFTSLSAAEVRAMWKMLIQRGTDLDLSFRNVVEGAESGSAHWDASYTFGATGRMVHNSIDATFRIRDGLIVEHVDEFDFWRWSRMALGPAGTLLGWTPLLRRKVQKTAGAQLAKFIARDSL